MRTELLRELPEDEFVAVYALVDELIVKGIRDNKGLLEIQRVLSDFLEEQKVSLDVREAKSKNSLLHCAATRGDVNVIYLLIQARLDLNSQNRFSHTPLYYACLSERENAVKLLLDEGADPNLGNPGDTPFLATISDDNTIEEKVNAAIVRRLIERGVNVNQLSKEGFSPLQLAVIHRKELIVKVIVNTGRANLQFADIDGNTVLHMVAKYRDKNTESVNLKKEKNIAEFLIQHSDAINSQNNQGDTPLHLAVANGNRYVVKLLLEKDYLFPQMGLLRIKNHSGLTVIHTAIQAVSKRGNLELLKLLIRVATQEDLNSVNDVGETVLEMANRLIREVKVTHPNVLYDEGLLIRKALALSRTIHVGRDVQGMSKNAIGLSEWADRLSDRLEELTNHGGELADELSALADDAEKLASRAETLSNREEDSLSRQEIEALFADANTLFMRAEALFNRSKELFGKPRVLEGEEEWSHYVQALKEAKQIIEQSDYLAWKKEKSTLTSSFPDYQEFHNDLLYNYRKIEADYKSLARAAIKEGKVSEYERAYLTSSNNPLGYKEGLFSHLALASLYGELKKQIPTGVSLDDLIIHESYHYSEAFKLTQGPVDDDAYVVLQREIGVAEQANLGTYNVQQCVVAVAYDPLTGKVVLSHFDRYSGPLTFIKQILDEFDSSHKIDIHLSGGRDRSLQTNDQGEQVFGGKQVSDSNIDQVLKQIYFYEERFNVKSFDLGDKPSPAGIVFDRNSETLVHRTPKHSDESLHSRAIKMNRQMIKANYLRPLDKIDFSNSNEVSRKISFSDKEKQEIRGMYDYYTKHSLGQTEMWRHNQLLYPFIDVISKERIESTVFDREPLENIPENDNADFGRQLQDFLNSLDQSLPENQKATNSDLSVLREPIDPSSDQRMQIDTDTNFENEQAVEIQCMRDRKKRNIADLLCVDSRDEEEPQEEQRIRESFDTLQISKNIKNTEFYDRLLKISEQVSQDKTVDPKTEKALIAAIKDIDLDSIDPELKDLTRELKINSENKERIKNVLRRSGVAEKIGRVSEGAGFSYTVFLVGKHIANGNIEGLGYDALNLWILPKIGEKLSSQVLKWGEKYSSSLLKGFAPVIGRFIGNFGAFLGLAEAIKERENAKDPIDIKIADLNIATNAIFIAVDIPGMISGIRSALGVLGETTGILGEFAGPVGGLISVAVIVISDFIQAAFELEKLEEQISLIGQEEQEFYWDFFLGKKLPAYIERDIKAKNIYAEYIKKTIEEFEAYDVIVMTLPPLFITRETRISACSERCTSSGLSGAFCNSYEYEWSSQEEITQIEFDMSIRTKITNLWLNCFNLLIKPGEIILSNKRPTCLDNRIILQHAYSDDSVYDITCGPLVNDISAMVLNISDYMNLPGKKQRCDHRKKEKRLLSQAVEKWFFKSYVPDCDNAVVYKRNEFREPHRRIYYITSSTTELTTPNSTDIIFHGKEIVNIDAAIKNYDTVNRYHFSNLLEDCVVFQRNTTHFFYITGDQFFCHLGGIAHDQKNIVVIQGNFTDSKNVHSVIGNNETNYIEVSHANYVDGNGGNDIILAKQDNTTIKAYFGDFIDGNGLALLPMNFTDIVKMTCANNRTVIYSENAEPISVGQQTLIKTADNFFVTPSRIDEETVTSLQITKNVGYIVLHKELISLYDDAYFLDQVLTDLHKINNPNFGITKQLNSKNYHIIIGDRGHHIFYPDKESGSFYWEAPEDISHLYIFDKNSGDITISKANGLLDFRKLNKSSLLPTLNAEGEVKINAGNLQISLLKNYKNVTVTLDGKKYYKLQNAKLTRDYCSHDLRIDGKFSVNATDLLNHYNCFTFDSEKVLFLKSNENLLLLSNKRALFILAYYSLAQHWDLSIQLNNHIIKPKEFRKKANKPSFFRHYLVSEKGLQIYHNQPIHNHKMGLVDLKVKSLLDCDMKVIKDNLIISCKDGTRVVVANWNTYPPAREMAFIFRDAIVNAKCILSACNAANAIAEFQQEKRKIENKSLQQRREKRHLNKKENRLRDRLALVADNELAPARNLATGAKARHQKGVSIEEISDDEKYDHVFGKKNRWSKKLAGQQKRNKKSAAKEPIRYTQAITKKIYGWDKNKQAQRSHTLRELVPRKQEQHLNSRDLSKSAHFPSTKQTSTHADKREATFFNKKFQATKQPTTRPRLTQMPQMQHDRPLSISTSRYPQLTHQQHQQYSGQQHGGGTYAEKSISRVTAKPDTLGLGLLMLTMCPRNKPQSYRHGTSTKGAVNQEKNSQRIEKLKARLEKTHLKIPYPEKIGTKIR